MSNRTVQLVRELRQGVGNVCFFPEIPRGVSEEDLVRRLSSPVIRGTAFICIVGKNDSRAHHDST